MTAPEHVSVMMQEVLDHLPLAPGRTAVDGTTGLAGHATEIGKRIAPGGLLVALDWDEAMLAQAKEKLSALEGVDVKAYHADYRQLPEKLTIACAEAGRVPQADAVLLDLGLNNAQIEDPERGISYRADGPLDMRMDRSRGEPVSAVLNTYPAREIEDILRTYGDENWAKRIAEVIVDRRKQKPLETTADLVDCILAAVPPSMRDKRLHPARRSFQALRIYINFELEGLQEAIENIARCLAPGGVLVVLAYHSGEDRAVKLAMRNLARTEGFRAVHKKPLRPSAEEVAANPKSRSAVLRALERPLETARP